MRIKVILQNYNTTHTKYQELLSAMLKEQRGERMDEEFIRNRITELRLKKGVSEYQMSMELGQNRSYIQAISSGRSMPSMKQFLNICEYFEITPLQFFDAQENNPQLRAVHYRMRCGTQNAFPEGNGQTDAPGQATLWRWCGGWYCD